MVKKYSKRKGLKGKSRPSRYAPLSSQIQTQVNKAINKKMNNIQENKLLVLKTQRDIVPVPMNSSILPPFSNPTHVTGFIMGPNVPSQYPNYFNPLDGVSAIEGTSPRNERSGQYLYFKKTTMALSINMERQKADPSRPLDLNNPYRFRMIVFKEKRRNTSLNQNKTPSQTLFMSPGGDSFGSSTSTNVSGTDIFQSIINKKDWTILEDKKFFLQPASYDYDNSTATAVNAVHCNSNYPTRKDMVITVPWRKKVRYNNTTPENLAYNVGVLIYAECVSQKKTDANFFTVDIQGATSVLDN